jgi:hypothetical protein
MSPKPLLAIAIIENIRCEHCHYEICHMQYVVVTTVSKGCFMRRLVCGRRRKKEEEERRVGEYTSGDR